MELGETKFMNQTIESYIVIDFPDGSDEKKINNFSNLIVEHLSTSDIAVLVDFKNATFIYSNGIKQILNSYKACCNEDVYFGLINANDSIRSILNAVKIDSVLEIFSSLEDFKAIHQST